MAERIWYRVWTQRPSDRRRAARVHYILAVCLSEAAREVEEEFPHLLVTSATTLRQRDGSWVREGDTRRRVPAR